MTGPVNESLRAHVTRIGFDLSLGRTHVAALVWLDVRLRWDRQHYPGGRLVAPEDRTPRGPTGRQHPLGVAFGNWTAGMHGLISRGLVIHTHPDTVALPAGVKRPDQLPFRTFFRITPAGVYVVELLKEAGLYDEYRAAITLPDAPRRTRREGVAVG